jgi:hypothetical protein
MPVPLRFDHRACLQVAHSRSQSRTGKRAAGSQKEHICIAKVWRNNEHSSMTTGVMHSP